MHITTSSWVEAWLATPHVDSRGYVVEYLTQDCDTGEYKAEICREEEVALKRADQLSLTLKFVRVNYPDGFSTRVY